MTLIETIEYYQTLIRGRRSRKTADDVLKAMGVNKTIRKHVAATVDGKGRLIRTFSGH